MLQEAGKELRQVLGALEHQIRRVLGLDRKLPGYKSALTTYDNNTFMKVWIKE